MRLPRKCRAARLDSGGDAAGRCDEDHDLNLPESSESISELVTAPVFRVTLPTGETYITEDVELVDRPVYRCQMPNGTEALLTPSGDCAQCRPEVHRVGRRRNSALVTWMCTSGCGYYPPDLGGGPLDRSGS